MIKIPRKRKTEVKESIPFTDRYGNLIRIKAHTRWYDDHPPKVSNKAKKKIKTGKAKRLNERDINIFQNDDGKWWVIDGQEGDPNNDLLGVWETEKEAELHRAEELQKRGKGFKNICIKCGAENTLWPRWKGKKRFYVCENCNQPSKGVSKSEYKKVLDESDKIPLLEKRIRKLDREISDLESTDSLNEDIRDLDIEREELLEELEDLRKIDAKEVKCKECGGSFPKDIMRDGFCYTCYDNREIIKLWKKGKTKEEISDELDDISDDIIECAIKDEIESLEKQSPRE